jgi:Na+/melibiose symporter-like transporter
LVVVVVLTMTMTMMTTMIVTAVVTVITVHLHLNRHHHHHHHHHQSSEILQTVANRCWLLVLNQAVCRIHSLTSANTVGTILGMNVRYWQAAGTYGCQEEC